MAQLPEDLHAVAPAAGAMASGGGVLAEQRIFEEETTVVENQAALTTLRSAPMVALVGRVPVRGGDDLGQRLDCSGLLDACEGPKRRADPSANGVGCAGSVRHRHGRQIEMNAAALPGQSEISGIRSRRVTASARF
jgi:hypothetical protein